MVHQETLLLFIWHTVIEKAVVQLKGIKLKTTVFHQMPFHPLTLLQKRKLKQNHNWA